MINPLNSKEEYVEVLNKAFEKISLEPDSETRPMVRFRHKKGILNKNALIYYEGKYYCSVTGFAKAVTGDNNISISSKNGIEFCFNNQVIRWDDENFKKYTTNRLLEIYKYFM